MLPESATTTDWNLIALSMGSLVTFTGLMLLGALVFLSAHAVVPSLVITRQLSPRARVIQIGLYLASFVTVAIALYLFGQMVIAAVAVLMRLYPRWWI